MIKLEYKKVESQRAISRFGKLKTSKGSFDMPYVSPALRTKYDCEALFENIQGGLYPQIITPYASRRNSVMHDVKKLLGISYEQNNSDEEIISIQPNILIIPDPEYEAHRVNEMTTKNVLTKINMSFENDFSKKTFSSHLIKKTIFLPLIHKRGNIFILLNDLELYGEINISNYSQGTSEVYRDRGNIEHDRQGEKRSEKAWSTQLHYSYDFDTNRHESKRISQSTKAGHRTRGDNSTSGQRKEGSNDTIRTGAFVSPWALCGWFETTRQSIYDVCSSGSEYSIQVCIGGNEGSSSYFASQFCCSLFEAGYESQIVTEDSWSFRVEYNCGVFGFSGFGYKGGFQEGDMVNQSENTVRGWFEQLGFTVIHKGAPDFLVFRRDEYGHMVNIEFIEVKNAWWLTPPMILLYIFLSIVIIWVIFKIRKKYVVVR